MILDQDLVLSNAQAITDDAYATNVHDRGAAGATGKDLHVVFRVHTAFVSAGGATLQIELRTSAALDTGNLDSSYTKLLMSKPFTVAELVANNEIWKVIIPRNGIKRYFQPYYEVATSTFSAGKMDCFIVPDTEVRP